MALLAPPPMSRPTTTVCPKAGCPELRPCPVDGHEPKPWATSTRKEHVAASGWQQQRDNRRILRWHAYRCHVCGQLGALVVDHVIPLAEGGADTDDNKRPIHAEPCHREKTAAEAARARARKR